MTHAPGLWRVSTSEGDKNTYIVADNNRSSQSSGIVLIARMMKHRPGSADRVCPPEIQASNARLIAAAPELLAALKTALEIAPGSMLDTVWEREARSAIAKAERRRLPLNDEAMEA